MSSENPSDGRIDYDLFISYRRKDGRMIASWLRDRLVRYSLPRSFGVRSSKKLRVYLDTAYERATQDFWDDTILPALQKSNHFCVVATPGAAEPGVDGQANWVEREIEAFRQTNRAKNIFVIRPRGPALETLPGKLKELHPRIEQIEMREPSLWGRVIARTELRGALLQVAATLFEVPPTEMPLLRQEEERRRRRLAWSVAAASLILTLIVSFLAAVAFIERNAARTERDAAIARQLSSQAALMMKDDPATMEQTALMAAESLRRLASFDNDQVARQALSAISKPELVVADANNILAAAFSRDQQKFATGSDAKIANLYDLRTGVLIAKSRQGGWVRDVSFNLDGHLLVTGSEDRTARILEVDTAKEILKIELASKIFAVALSSSDLATGSDEGLHIFDITSRQLRWSVHSGRVICLAYSPDGRTLAAGGHEGIIRVFDASKGTEISRPAFPGAVFQIAFTPDGRHIVAVGQDNTARVFDAATGMQISLLRHAHPADSIAVSPDGRYAASGSEDETVRLFDVSTGTEIRRLSDNGEVPKAIAFTPDGKYLWVAWRGFNPDGIRFIRHPIWPDELVAEICSKLSRNFTTSEWHRYLGDIPYRKTCRNIP